MMPKTAPYLPGSQPAGTESVSSSRPSTLPPRTTSSSRPTISVPKEVASANDEIARFEDVGWGINSLAISPNGRFVVAGKLDRAVNVYDLDRKLLVGERTELAHLGQVNCTQFAPSGKKVLTGGYSGEIQIWEFGDTGQIIPVEKFVGHTSEIKCIDISNNGTTVLSGERDKRLRCWNLETRREDFAIAEFSREVLACRIVEDGNFGLACGQEKLVKFDLQTGNVLDVRQVGRGYHMAAAFSDDGKYLAVSTGSDVEVLEAGTGKTVATIKSEGVAWSLRFVPETTYLITGGRAEISWWDYSKQAFVASQKVGTFAYVKSFAVSNDRKRVVAIGSSVGQALEAFKVPSEMAK